MLIKMLNKIKGSRGQSTLEYAILIVVVIGALITIQFYIKRGVQGGIKTQADNVGEQFSPGIMNYVKTTHTSGSTNDKNLAGVASTNLLLDEKTTKTINSEFRKDHYNEEYWGNNKVN